jgi:thiol-disulfide isomerase/thioredoxin
MKKPLLPKICMALAGLLISTSAARAELMVGDHPPPLQAGKWIQGEPVRGFDTNHVYIVEFWATWCGPCVGSIPHLNKLWEKFKDQGVIVIGQDVWDSDEAVAPFVTKMGTNMTYRVALDDKRQDPDGFMSSHWWPRKVNHHGIPTAFIINREGRIAWIGHPMGLKEQVLDDILSGHYDLAKAAVDYKEAAEKNDKFQDLQATLFSTVKQKQWNAAESALNGISTLYPKSQGFTSTRLKVLLGQGRINEAYAFAAAFSDAHLTNDFWQNELAWTIATSDNADQHCLELAEKMAERAVQLSSGTNSASLDTLARTQFTLGQKQEAIATEEKAVNLETDTHEKGDFEKTLASYRDGKLPDANE